MNAVAVTLLAASGWLSSEGFKLIVLRARLNSSLLVDPLVPESGWDSFPSGHTSFAVALAIALYLLARNTRWSTPVLCAGVVFALLVGASRLYLGVHYPSDIAGAFSRTLRGNRLRLRTLEPLRTARAGPDAASGSIRSDPHRAALIARPTSV